jgi:hypothetical protein
MDNIIIKEQANLSFNCKEILFEAPCEVRNGAYDIETVGAFSYFGGQNAIIRHVSSMGRFCVIAPNVQIGLIEHPTDFLSPNHIFTGGGVKQLASIHLNDYRRKNLNILSIASEKWIEKGKMNKIKIGHDVWIGEGAMIARNLEIGDGAIIAARSVVTKSVPPYTIVGGVPAKTIKTRFPEKIIERLLKIKWYEYGLSALDGVNIFNISEAIEQLEKNITLQTAIFKPAQFIWKGKQNIIKI